VARFFPDTVYIVVIMTMMMVVILMMTTDNRQSRINVFAALGTTVLGNLKSVAMDPAVLLLAIETIVSYRIVRSYKQELSSC